MDDGPEVAVDVHLDDPPAQVSSIKTRIKSLATGVWDLLKRLTEYMAPTVVRTPATSATAEVLDPEIDPDDFGLSVPENALITRQHNRRFDWQIFARDLKIETLNSKVEDKPMIYHKAPPIFTWPENQSWNCMDRIAPRLKVPTPDPWSNTEYLQLAESAIDPLATRPRDAASAFNNWIWTWAYVDPNQKTDVNRLPDKYPLGVYFTILWMAGLVNASNKYDTPVENLFSDKDKSDLIRFMARCTEVIDPRVRKAISHYGHIPIWYEAGDGTNHYPDTDTLWADKGNAMYSWMCKKRGFFKEYNLNAESHGDLMEVCFNLCYMHVVIGINLPELFKFTNAGMSTWFAVFPPATELFWKSSEKNRILLSLHIRGAQLLQGLFAGLARGNLAAEVFVVTGEQPPLTCLESDQARHATLVGGVGP